MFYRYRKKYLYCELFCVWWKSDIVTAQIWCNVAYVWTFIFLKFQNKSNNTHELIEVCVKRPVIVLKHVWQTEWGGVYFQLQTHGLTSEISTMELQCLHATAAQSYLCCWCDIYY